jgi:hypothetical protein
MSVDTSAVGKQTRAWRVVLDRSVLRNFARAVGDTSDVYRRANDVPAPPTFTFAAPHWAPLSSRSSPKTFNLIARLKKPST